MRAWRRAIAGGNGVMRGWDSRLLMEGIRRSPVEVGSLSHYLQGFIHPRWLFRISEPSINYLNTFDGFSVGAQDNTLAQKGIRLRLCL